MGERAKPLRILCVDDDQEILNLLDRLLQKYDFEVLTASSGEEALNLFRYTPIDLALVDIQMKNMSGLDLLEKFRDQQPNFPVVMMTGQPTDEFLFKAVELACDGFVEKPFDTDYLVTILNQVAQSPVRKLTAH